MRIHEHISNFPGQRSISYSMKSQLFKKNILLALSVMMCSCKNLLVKLSNRKMQQKTTSHCVNTYYSALSQWQCSAWLSAVPDITQLGSALFRTALSNLFVVIFYLCKEDWLFLIVRHPWKVQYSIYLWNLCTVYTKEIHVEKTKPLELRQKQRFGFFVE